MTDPERATQPIEELQLETVAEDDAIVLKTHTGSIYHLQIVEMQGTTPVAIVGRDSAEPVWRTDDMPVQLDDHLKLKLKGSCEAISYQGGERLYPVNETDGYFKVGERAWLAKEDDNNLITSTVESIELIRAD